LRFVNGKQPFDCFDLDDQLLLGDEVESVATIELDVLVPDG
jgi:hypothetical protein